MHATTRALCAVTVPALIIAAGLAIAGPLDPPTGAVTPTFKTLGDIEPRTAISAANTPGDSDSVYRITQPGSYYLTGNIDAPNNFAAIEVAADRVSIDLNGFTVLRSAAGASTRSLVRIESNFVVGTTVRNGAVVNSGLHGVELGGGAKVEHVRVIEPAGRGVMTFGNATVTDCWIQGPGAQGVYTQSSSIIQRVTVDNGGAEGIYCFSASVVADCVVTYCADSGIYASNQTTVERCNVMGCDGWGISAGLNSLSQVIRNNTVYMNEAGGIRVYHRARVEGNLCESTGSAVVNILAAGHGNRIQDNQCSNGTDAVKADAATTDNLVIGNSSVNATVGNGFANVSPLNNQVGPVVATAGTITSTSPWANFSR